MKARSWGLALLILAGGGAASADPAPAWFLEEIAALTGGTGRWTADNAKYQSDQEPYETYGMVWTASFDGTTMTGRLFGMKGGKETGAFWEFRQYWDPDRNEAVLMQFGWGGAVGIGVLRRDGDVTRSDQVFHTPGAASRRTGHRSSFPEPDIHVTESFDIEGEAWKPRRSYTWKRTPESD